METRNHWCLLGFPLLVATGCTAITIKPVERSKSNIQSICIEENPAVNKDGFLPMLENSLKEHKISSQRYVGTAPSLCDYTLHYVAHWAWDLAVYMRDAEISVRQGPNTIGKGIYHLRGGGGLALSKFASAESKVVPVMDKLFEQFPKESPDVPSLR